MLPDMSTTKTTVSARAPVPKKTVSFLSPPIATAQGDKQAAAESRIRMAAPNRIEICIGIVRP
jgi:hypothetical protein